MAISMFNISVPIFVRHLNGLAHCLKKAQALYTEKKYDEGSLVNYRLFPDMFSFARQIQQATDHARNCAAASALRSARRPQMTTSAPARASPSAMASPSPELAPVTSATLPVRSNRFSAISGS